MVATTSIFLSSGNSVKDSTSTLSMCCLSINEISFLIAGAVIKTGFLFSFCNFSMVLFIELTIFCIRLGS